MPVHGILPALLLGDAGVADAVEEGEEPVELGGLVIAPFNLHGYLSSKMLWCMDYDIISYKQGVIKIWLTLFLD